MVKKMSNGFIKEKIKTDEKKRQRSDRNLRIFMCIFLIGYIFFYTSNYTFPKVYKKRQTTIFYFMIISFRVPRYGKRSGPIPLPGRELGVNCGHDRRP